MTPTVSDINIYLCGDAVSIPAILYSVKWQDAQCIMNRKGRESKQSGPDQPPQNLCAGADVNPQSGYSAFDPRFEPRTSRTQTKTDRALDNLLGRSQRQLLSPVVFTPGQGPCVTAGD